MVVDARVMVLDSAAKLRARRKTMFARTLNTYASITLARASRRCLISYDPKNSYKIWRALPEFLRLPIEERKGHIPQWSELAKKHGLKMLFWGTAMGVKEHAVFVFESNGNSGNFFNFQREWLGLGIELAGTIIDYTRTITVH